MRLYGRIKIPFLSNFLFSIPNKRNDDRTKPDKLRPDLRTFDNRIINKVNRTICQRKIPHALFLLLRKIAKKQERTYDWQHLVKVKILPSTKKRQESGKNVHNAKYDQLGGFGSSITLGVTNGKNSLRNGNR